ncbi:MAG: Gfo/Idh/MocA family protein [Candidatus Brocadiia bacterium]
MSTVRMGIVGLGWWACDVHIPNLLRVPGAAVAALCSRSAASVERGRQALGGQAEPAVFHAYERLLASDAVDAVLICTPNALHGPMTLEALRAGKHVLVEKPLALQPAQCQAIAQEAERRKLAVQVGVELRYSDVARAMRRLVEEGAVGAPALARTTVWREWGAPGSWRADEAQSGGLFHELAVHYLDLFDVLVGRLPRWVAAAGGAKATGRDLDYAVLTAGYEGGALASAGLCLFAAGSGDDLPLEVVGTEGRLAGDVVEGSLALWPREGERRDLSPPREGGPVFGFPGSRESVADFVDCVRSGRRPWADAPTGHLLCRLCEAARRSVGQGGGQVAVEP